jgi:hypothetical protein
MHDAKALKASSSKFSEPAKESMVGKIAIVHPSFKSNLSSMYSELYSSFLEGNGLYIIEETSHKVKLASTQLRKDETIAGMFNCDKYFSVPKADIVVVTKKIVDREKLKKKHIKFGMRLVLTGHGTYSDTIVYLGENIGYKPINSPASGDDAFIKTEMDKVLQYGRSSHIHSIYEMPEEQNALISADVQDIGRLLWLSSDYLPC